VPDPDGRPAGTRTGVGVVARTAALLLAVALSVGFHGAKLLVANGLCWALAAAIHPSAFRVLRRPILWLLLAGIVWPALVFATPRDVALPFGLHVASLAVTLAWTMACRSLIIVVAAAGFGSGVSVSELTALFELAGLRGLGFSLGVAVHALPLAERTWATSAKALRLRGGFRRNRLRHAVLLATTVIGNSLRHADEVVEAASARGFSPARHRTDPPARWRSDLVWVSLWVVVALVLAVA
jgi:energy-coupling factor transporter transmembrane protein EcfT